MSSSSTVHWEVLQGVGAVVSGAHVPLGGPRQRQVAAMLVLCAPGPVSTSRFAETLWGTEPPRTARNSVQRFVADLRHTLGVAADRLTTVPEGNQLRLQDGDSSDRDRLTQGRDQARRLLARGDPRDAIAVIDAALPAHPEPLAGLGASIVLDEERHLLEDLVATAARLRIEALLAAGEHSRAVPECERLVAAHPFHERLWALLMVALFGAGQEHDALETYQRLRTLLADELGQEPSVQLRMLHLRMLQQDESLALEPPPVPDNDLVDSGASVPAAGLTEPTFIPRFRSAFLGREQDIAGVRAELTRRRLVSIVGPGGIGKTRLAAQVATLEHAEGRRVWFVQLAGVGSGGELPALAAALRIAATSEPAVAEVLAVRTGTVVLDNCEHVLSSLVPLIDRLSLACDDVTFLATSREPLHLEGEQVMRLAALDSDSTASQLFRARAAEAGATLTDSDEQRIQAVCERVDGLPLAIEIAASQSASLGLRALQDSLDDRLSGLREQDRDVADARHSTLDAAINWSYRLLTGAQRRTLRALAVFVGGFELDAATHVLGGLGTPVTAVPALLAGLTDRSLIMHEQLHDQDQVIDRYRLLETVRAFALDELAAHHQDQGAAQRAQAGWIADLACAGDGDIASLPCHLAAVRLEREVENWRAAAAYVTGRNEPDLVARLTGSAFGVLNCARPDLGPIVTELAEGLSDDHPVQLAVAAAHFASGYATLDPRAVKECLSILRRVDPDDSSGRRRNYEAGYLIMAGDRVEQATALRADLVDDLQVPASLRDHILANALYGVHVAGRPDLEGPDWRQRVMAIAAHSDVPVTRLLARLAIGRALERTSPDRSLDWARLALAETGPIPLFFRRLWRASVSRLLMRSDPAHAAADLQTMLTEQIRRGETRDWTLIVTTAALLAQVDHPLAADAMATIASTDSAANLARTVPDLDARARQGSVIDIEDLIRQMATALSDVASSAEVYRDQLLG